MRKVFLFIIFTTMSSALLSQSLYTEIADSEDHTTFLDLLEFTGLDTLLLTDGYYSVFAPINEAFEYHLDSAALDSLKVNDPAFLESLLLNHFVADTVFPDYISAPYLPLSGSHFSLFVDATGSVLLHPITDPTGEPTIYLTGTYGNEDLFTDLDNGRLFGLQQNIIYPNCKTTAEWYDVIKGPLLNVIVQANWVDTLLNFSTPLTFLCPSTNDIYDYIDQNGGMGNTPFLDSLIRRHIINDYLSLQEVEDGTVVENLLGEEVLFSKQDGHYYLSDSTEIWYFYDYKKSAAITMDSFLLEPIVFTTETVRIDLELLKIFPNPASDIVTIMHSGSSNRSIVTIYTIDGRFISRGEYLGSEFDVDIRDLNAGLYILEYQNHSHLERTRLMVF
jgi:uncharacterized surface protein with fasciclin (FAS1) repeats